MSRLADAPIPAPHAPVVVAIDDDPLVLKAMERALQAGGMVCRTARTGAAGLQLIRDHAPDLVLLDLMLEAEDGFSICREIRTSWSAEELPVVVVTGREDLDSIQAAYQAGANDYLTKPLHWKHLPYRVQHVLRARDAYLALEERTRTLHSVFAAHPDPIFTVDTGGVVTLVHSGIRGEDNAVRPSLGTLEELLPDTLLEQVRACLREALRLPQEVIHLEAVHAFAEVERCWEGRFIATGDDQVLVMIRDITERKEFEQRIRHMAFHDALTGLWNRHALASTLERVCQDLVRTEATPYPQTGAVLYLDLDNFKRINDTLGHAVGDELLKEVAHRISDVLRPTDIVARADSGEDEIARIGGDEFCLILRNLPSAMEAGKVAQRILEVVREPILLEGHELVVTPSIGIAVIPQDGRDPDTVLKHADRAMYAAKEGGRNRFQYFDASMDSRLQERFALEAGMRRGLARGAFRVHFQPQIDARTGEVLGMEALLRWEDPEMGSVAPAKFIPVAEETGLILDLGEFVFRESLRFVRSLAEDGLPPIRVAVNLSSIQILDPQMLARLEHCLSVSGADPSQLEVEVTESVLMESSEQALEVLRQIKDMGITLALDDFGTGYSSLSYLHTFPFDILKIDQSFVRGMGRSVTSQGVVKAILALAEEFGLATVAEGVETHEEAAVLRALGCDAGQGYLFARPQEEHLLRWPLEPPAQG